MTAVAYHELGFPKRRGRPSLEMVAAREAYMRQQPFHHPLKLIPTKTDEEILSGLRARFSVLDILTESAYLGNIPAAVVVGAPGIGKSFTIKQRLIKEDITHTVISGSISAIELYRTGYEYRHRGNVIVLDDVDSIFADEECLNLLKAMSDSGVERTVSYLKQSRGLKAEGEEDVPTSYDFCGSIICVSNLDFQKYIDAGTTRLSKHFEALQSRASYLDLRLFDRRSIHIWLSYLARDGRIFDTMDIDRETGEEVLEWLGDNKDSLRSLSIRTLKLAVGYAKTHPDWRTICSYTFCRNQE